MRSYRVCRLVLTASSVLLALAHPRPAAGGENEFADASFEFGTRGAWRLDTDKGTVAALTVDGRDAAFGQRSATVTINALAGWGTQFGQRVDAGPKGKTYTFAGFIKPIRADVAVRLEVERHGTPYDRAARTEEIKLPAGKWTELHVTFRIEKDFREDWFAYVSCRQPHCQFRADMFRLYEGPYKPYHQADATATVRLFDTGRPSAGPVTGKALAGRTGWTLVPEDDVKHALAGDAVLLNNKVALVLRRGAAGAELYGRGAAGARLRGVLTPLAAGAKLTGVRITANSPAEAAVEATFAAGKGKPVAVSYTLKPGLPLVKTAPGPGAEGLGLDAPCRFAVLPDFFADDIVVDATQLPVAEADLPSEHFLLHLVGAGEAVVMTVWDRAQRDVRVRLAGQGADRQIRRSEIPYGKGGSVWVAVLEEPGIWHACNVRRDQADKEIPLDWHQPFPALWRVDWTRSDKLTGSWGMILEAPNGKYTKYTWLATTYTLPHSRERWTTVLGTFDYPCWIDRGGRGYLQPLRKGARFEGPAVIYPVNRAGNHTPTDRYTVVDIVREALGVGPCNYILDIENQDSQYKGIATCSTRDRLGRIYGRGQQRQREAEIETILLDVMVFIRHIRARIEAYVVFGHELRDYLAAQKKARPELAGPIGELEKLTAAIDDYYARRREAIKTPEKAKEWTEEFRRTLLTYTGPDALERVKKYTHAWVGIGSNQDELVGECRMTVKWVRQRAGLLLATDPRMAEIAREVRRRTQVIMRNPSAHEAAQH